MKWFNNNAQWRESSAYFQWKSKVSTQWDGKCAVTGRVDQVDYHHAYSAKAYPHLRFHPLNDIILSTDIHQRFHADMGGTHIPCTAHDWNKWVKKHYPNRRQARMVNLILRYHLKRFFISMIISAWGMMYFLHQVLG